MRSDPGWRVFETIQPLCVNSQFQCRSYIVSQLLLLALHYIPISSLIIDYTDDYENFSGVLVFSRNTTEVCHSINITDDEVCEYDGCESGHSHPT